jgi:hypothetical protein
MPSEQNLERRPSLSVVALVSFTASFIVARAFTTLNPGTVLIGFGLHVHHFWFGLAMLAIGGWLGISYNEFRVNRVAAILFGSGGGLIGDEVGLLLTMGDYWTELTYTVVIVFLAAASVLILVVRYFDAIRREFGGFLSSSASLYVGVFLAAVSVAFVLETSDPVLTAVSSASTVVSCLIILFYLVQRLRNRQG